MCFNFYTANIRKKIYRKKLFLLVYVKKTSLLCPIELQNNLNIKIMQNFKIKGIICDIGEITTTKLGTAVQQIHFEDSEGRFFYPQCLGTKIELLNDLLPGDVCELEFHISGSKGKFNNVIIDNLFRV